MRLVSRPVFKPQRCAAVPYIGQTATEERWVDTGSEMDGFDNHIYLSESAVKAAGDVLGIPSIKDHVEVLRLLVLAEQEIKYLKLRIAEMEPLESAFYRGVNSGKVKVK